MKGLKMHQRKCRVIFGFDDSHLNEHIDEDSGSDAENVRNRPTVMACSHYETSPCSA